MAASVVQSNSGFATTTTPTVVLGVAPTAGNTLVAVVGSDTTHGVPTAGAGKSYTQRLGQVAQQGFYVWTRLVVAGDSATTTFAPTSASPSAMVVAEIAGTFDKTGTGFTITGSNAASVPPTGLSPATTDGLVIAAGGMHNATGSAPSGGSVDNTFTLLRTAFNAAAGATSSNAITASKVTTSTAATGTTTLSWTNNCADRDGVQIAFTGLAGAAAIPPILTMQTRRAY